MTLITALQDLRQKLLEKEHIFGKHVLASAQLIFSPSRDDPCAVAAAMAKATF